ncbi:MAG: hypothetical protein VCD33_17630, partial [Alphaproteobacteria bacterium]
MLREIVTGNTGDKGLAFSAALALHCFINEYVFPESDEETAALEALRKQIATLVKNQRNVPAPLIAALGAYRALHGFPWAPELYQQTWPGSIKDVINRQISEALQEQSQRARIIHLTAIRDTISRSVRGQYEENPYP